MNQDTPLPFDLPAVARKKLTVDFAGGNLSSDGGLLLLRQAEAATGVCKRLAEAMPDDRDPARVVHAMTELVTMRAMAIATGYIDGIDLNTLRHDPLLKLAIERHPETGTPLASQSTISRLENAPTKREALRLTAALVDQFATSVTPGAEEILDIDDTFCVAHGGQQMALWNAHHDERGFAPMHVYHAGTGLPVVTILRPARTPSGTELLCVVKRLTQRLKQHWLSTTLIWRGDSHYCRSEAMDWIEANDGRYIFGLAGNAVLHRLMAETADDLRFQHVIGPWDEKRRCYMSFEYKAKRWSKARRVVARLEASLVPDPKCPYGDMRQEVDIRYVVTNLEGDAQHLYENVYCQRGQMENLIKLHKSQLGSDRLSCHSATANQVRLVLHTAAFWLVHKVRAAVPAGHALAKAEFTTLREKLFKIGVRVIEHAARIRIHLPTSCVEAALFRHVALALMPAQPTPSRRVAADLMPAGP